MDEHVKKMREMYGEAEGKCRECSNFRPIKKWTIEGAYAKCAAYGIDNTKDTDWYFELSACGLKNKDYIAEGIMPLIEQERKDTKTQQQKLSDRIGDSDGNE